MQRVPYAPVCFAFYKLSRVHGQQRDLFAQRGPVYSCWESHGAMCCWFGLTLKQRRIVEQGKVLLRDGNSRKHAPGILVAVRVTAASANFEVGRRPRGHSPDGIRTHQCSWCGVACGSVPLRMLNVRGNAVACNNGGKESESAHTYIYVWFVYAYIYIYIYAYIHICLGIRKEWSSIAWQFAVQRRTTAAA